MMSKVRTITTFVLLVVPLATAQLSASQKQAILGKHNELRASVKEPCTAADMEKLAWDDTLALKAEARAATCKFETADSPAGTAENIAMALDEHIGEDVVKSLTQWWYNEKQDLNWNQANASTVQAIERSGSNGTLCFNGEKKCIIGHYTTLVNAATNKLGCGLAGNCSFKNQSAVLLVCMYSPGGNIEAAVGKGQLPPWITGTPCAACGGAGAATCEKGLCTGNVSRCADEFSPANPTEFNGRRYTSCEDLIDAFEDHGGTEVACQSGWYGKECPVTCDACEPGGMDATACGNASAAKEYSVWSTTTTTTTTTKDPDANKTTDANATNVTNGSELSVVATCSCTVKDGCSCTAIPPSEEAGVQLARKVA